jgi:hypothetical protein
LRRAFPWVALLLAGVALAGSATALFVAARTLGNARGARANAAALLEARRDLAEAQGGVGESHIEEAVTTAGRANAAARRVARLIERTIAALEPAVPLARTLTGYSTAASGDVTFARRQTLIAARLLGAIAGYQKDAGRYALVTNRALERILEALRKTNDDFPGRSR